MRLIDANGGLRRARRARPVAEVLEGRQLLATITVTSAGDADGADGSGTLSLRQAIEVANGTLAVSALTSGQQALVAGALSSPNTIDFDIPGTGPFTIKPAKVLPQVTTPVIIDGYSQPGASPNTGTLQQADDAVLRIGIDFSGESGAQGGLSLVSSGNTVQGLALFGAQANEDLNLGSSSQTAGSLIQGNFIGTDTTGTVAPANQAFGILSADSFDTIGGTTPASRNLISGNARSGIYLEGSSNLVAGNFIGTDPTGVKALPNQADGVFVTFKVGNTIGGTATGAGNVISGNLGNGISLAYLTLVAGPNGVTISTPTSDDVIQGNFIGVDATGTIAIPNLNHGIGIDGGVACTIGGTVAGAANIIAFNGSAGVGLSIPTIPDTRLTYEDTISGNSIYGNGGLGIDLGDDGVTPNTTTGTYLDPNEYQPYPVITGTSGATFDASLTAAPSTAYTIEFYASPQFGNDTGEGKFYLGSQVVTTDSTGLATFSYTLPAADADLVLSMTATDPIGDTSEFSPQDLATVVTVPVVNDLFPPVAVTTSTRDVQQGQPLSILAAVGSDASGQPTGLVAFVVDGTTVGFAPLDAGGFATFSAPTGQFAIGAGHTIEAVYLGDSTFPSSVSFPQYSFSVTPPPAISIVGSSSITPQGQPITFAAAIGPSATGLVAFVDNGSNVLGYAPLDASGIATFVTDQLTPGGHDVSAVYLGDATHPAVISAGFGVGIVAGTSSQGPAVTSQAITGSNTILLSFNQALLQASAQGLANYAITGPAGQAIAITAAAYDPTTRSVTLVTQQALNPTKAYKLTVKGGIEDVFGLALNAKSKGGPGSNTVVNIRA